MGKTRKSFHFDLDTKKMKQCYDSRKNYRQGYYDIKKFMLKNGFVHEQGSGYTSKKALTDTEALSIALQLKSALPWLEKCIRVFTVTDFRKGKDITGILTSKPASIEPKKQLTLDDKEFETATISIDDLKNNVPIAQEIYEKSPKQKVHQNKRSKNEEL